MNDDDPTQNRTDQKAADQNPDDEVEGYLQGSRSSVERADLPPTFPLLTQGTAPPTTEDDAVVDDAVVDDAVVDDAVVDDAVVDDAAVDEVESSRETRAERDARLRSQQHAGEVRVTTSQRTQTTRRSLLSSAAAVAVAGVGWRWLQTQPEENGVPAFLRDGFEWNEEVWSTLFDEGGLAPEFAESAATELRLNGSIGLGPELVAEDWTMRVEGVDGQTLEELTIDDVSFDQVAGIDTFDQITEHKCIEGWANITHWTGVRLGDVATRYEEQMSRAEYVSLETPDGEYYVGLDMASAMHPQTLLVSGLDGQALAPEHGAPLRLVTPLHYGIKSIKRIGVLRFSEARPDDYWADRGYDWHSTH